MTTTRISHLYKITDTARNKFYIGKHLGNSQGSYWGSGTRIVNHVKKYGTGDLKYEILAIGTEQYIYAIEASYINSNFLKQNSNCLNILAGGKGNHNAKCGSTIGRVAPNKGKKTPKSVRLKQRLAKLGKPGNRAGTLNSAETRLKISLSNKGRKFSSEHIKKLGDMARGRVLAKTTCPHCNLIGGKPAMKRWHFDKCKNKE